MFVLFAVPTLDDEQIIIEINTDFFPDLDELVQECWIAEIASLPGSWGAAPVAQA